MRIFRYVDDFLVFLECDEKAFDQSVGAILDIFQKCLDPLDITHEKPEDGNMRFLDIALHSHPNHTCWSYEPRARKPLLPYQSAHSKLVKRGIVKMCIKNALEKSCVHALHSSFTQQVDRMEKAGYPRHVVVSVAETILKSYKSHHNLGERGCGTSECTKMKTAVVPYVHGVSHGLKKIAKRVNVRVAFSAPQKLSRLAAKTTSLEKKEPGCQVKHRNRYTECVEGVIYSIPLTCGKQYVGQTGRCVNDRLREHSNNVRQMNSGHLALHCSTCDSAECKPLFERCRVVGRSASQLTREIIEAAEIAKLGDKCVSVPSIALMEKEVRYMSRAHDHRK